MTAPLPACFSPMHYLTLKGFRNINVLSSFGILIKNDMGSSITGVKKSATSALAVVTVSRDKAMSIL